MHLTVGPELHFKVYGQAWLTARGLLIEKWQMPKNYNTAGRNEEGQ